MSVGLEEAARLRDAYARGAVPLRDALDPTAGLGAIPVELGRRRTVGGQEDMIVDVALDLAGASRADARG